MARSHVNHFSIHPYHITGRTVNRIPYNLPLDQVWEILSDHLFLAHHCYGLRIHSFVLMPNHFHLIASITSHALPVVMNRFMGDSSKEFNYRMGRINQNWGGPHFKCEIPSYHYFMNCYKYVYQNPVRAGLASFVEDWPFSSLSGLLGRSNLVFPVCEDTLLFDENRLSIQNLQWLNQPIEAANLDYMKLGLMKRSFKLPNGNDRHKNPIEYQLI